MPVPAHVGTLVSLTMEKTVEVSAEAVVVQKHVNYCREKLEHFDLSDNQGALDEVRQLDLLIQELMLNVRNNKKIFSECHQKMIDTPNNAVRYAIKDELPELQLSLEESQQSLLESLRDKP